MELEGYEAIETLGESGTAVLLRASAVDDTPVVIKLLKNEYPTPEEVAAPAARMKWWCRASW